jgi:ABC transport system ATP-binding/permease protein
MSLLLGIHSLSKSYGTQILFEELSFGISEKERIALIGPNGTGKSTLLKILMGLEAADSGQISRRQRLRLGYASQAPEFTPEPILDVLLKEAARADQAEALIRARTLLSKMQFSDFAQNAATLSGGWKKRLDIARALMSAPDLLLLDEPTNHLDLEGILWLEKFLMREPLSYLLVSHDRYFLETVSNKTIELNRCYPQGLFSVDGNISSFMQRKAAFLEAQAQEERGMASVARDEVEWMNRSPKARTTKSRSRIQKAYELLEQLSEIKGRNKVSKVKLDFTASERETRKLLAAKNLSKSIAGKPLFNGIDLVLSPGSRLGIVGPNGSGKTTLLRILAGQIPQDMGTIKYADDLKIVYFDQHREQLPGEITLRRALSPNSDIVHFRGNPIHVNGWAKKFLFSPERLELPVKCLSGGERARILIAKLMLEPADILFLDEPTNDLDIPTLEVIEESLTQFAGAVVLISHDRCLMDRICTQILGLGSELEQRYFADYAQWEAACQKIPISQKSAAPEVKTASRAAPAAKQKKLPYHEQKELDNMEQQILKKEAEVALLQQQLDHAQTKPDAAALLDLYQKLGQAQNQLEHLFERWQYLESKLLG